MVWTLSSYSIDEFKAAANRVTGEHREAVDASEGTGEALARAERKYHRELAIQVAMAKQEFGATVAETMAKGHSGVLDAKEERDIAAVKDRAAMERIRLCRDDRQVLLTAGAWSRSQEAWES